MSPEQKAAIEWQCQQLALKYMMHSDRQEWDAKCALLTEDAEFARPTDPDNPTVGRDNILASFKGRPANRVTRHICTNMLIEAESATRASGTIYALLYTGDSADEADLGIRANSKQLVGEFYDRYELTDAGWRIASRSGRIVFTVG